MARALHVGRPAQQVQLPLLRSAERQARLTFAVLRRGGRRRQHEMAVSRRLAGEQGWRHTQDDNQSRKEQAGAQDGR